MPRKASPSQTRNDGPLPLRTGARGDGDYEPPTAWTVDEGMRWFLDLFEHAGRFVPVVTGSQPSARQLALSETELRRDTDDLRARFICVVRMMRDAPKAVQSKQAAVWKDLQGKMAAYQCLSSPPRNGQWLTSDVASELEGAILWLRHRYPPPTPAADAAPQNDSALKAARFPLAADPARLLPAYQAAIQCLDTAACLTQMFEAALGMGDPEESKRQMLKDAAGVYCRLIVEIRFAEGHLWPIQNELRVAIGGSRGILFKFGALEETTAIQTSVVGARRLVNDTLFIVLALNFPSNHPYNKPGIELPVGVDGELGVGMQKEWAATILPAWRRITGIGGDIKKLQAWLRQEADDANAKFIAPLRGGENSADPPGIPGRAITAIDAEKQTITVRGDTVPLMPDQFQLVVEIIKGRGQWVGLTKQRGPKRPDKIIKRVDRRVGQFIKSKDGAGGGYKIDPKYIAPGAIGT